MYLGGRQHEAQDIDNGRTGDAGRIIDRRMLRWVRVALAAPVRR